MAIESSDGVQYQFYPHIFTYFADYKEKYADLAPGKNHVHTPGLDDASDTCESDNSELGLNKHDLEGWQDVESDTSGCGDDEESDLEDSEEDFMGM